MNLRFPGTGSLGSSRGKNKLTKEYRRFSSLLIDERLLIDPSEDIFEFEESFMLSGICRGAKDILITHSHLGHLSVSAIERLAASGGINVYASGAVGNHIRELPGVCFHEIQPLSLVRIGSYDVIPLPSNHSTDVIKETAFNFLIRGERTVFYGLDGAWICPDAWRVLRELHPDVFILDCGMGCDAYGEGCVYHNNIDMIIKMRELFVASGVCSDSTKFILSHIPTVKKRFLHEELCEAVRDLPAIKVAYDGYYLGL